MQYANNADIHNMAQIMQSYAAISGAMAGFAIAVIVFLIGSRQARDRKHNETTLIEPVITILFAAFFSVFLASYLFASGGGQPPSGPNRSYAVMMAAYFPFATSMFLFLQGFILLVVTHKLKYTFPLFEFLQYVGIISILIAYSVMVGEGTKLENDDSRLLKLVPIALLLVGLCILIRKLWFRRKKKSFYQRGFRIYLVTCIILGLVSYLIMSLSFEENEPNYSAPTGVGWAFLIALSILGGWSMIYTPSRNERKSEDWGNEEKNNKITSSENA